MTNSTPLHRNLADILRETLSQQDLLDLWLIRNPIIDPHQMVEEIKQSLGNYDDLQDELGIEYSGSLVSDDEPTRDELLHALDDIKQVREKHSPETKRSNFWFVDKQYNERDGYTRYILANGSERIVTDDELQDNPTLAYHRALSDAREENDMDEYNRLKQERAVSKIKSNITSNADTSNDVEQCFLKVGSKLYGDVVNIPTNIIKSKDKNKLVSYLSMFSSPIRELQKLQTKIKLINTNNQTMAIL